MTKDDGGSHSKVFAVHGGDKSGQPRQSLITRGNLPYLPLPFTRASNVFLVFLRTEGSLSQILGERFFVIEETKTSMTAG